MKKFSVTMIVPSPNKKDVAKEVSFDIRDAIRDKGFRIKDIKVVEIDESKVPIPL